MAVFVNFIKTTRGISVTIVYLNEMVRFLLRVKNRNNNFKFVFNHPGH